MHAAALRYAGLDGEYRLIDVPPEGLSERVREMREEGFRGCNVTIPHKQAMHAICGELTKPASDAGAVNTVLFEDDGTLKGHNTDIGGFQNALVSARGGHPINRALVLGAGGAARAAVLALKTLDAEEVVLSARDVTKTSTLMEIFDSKKISATTLEDAAKTAVQLSLDLIVNCTPIGQKDSHIPNSIVTLIQNSKKSTFLFDMVYAKDGKTPLVELARAHGLSSCDGLDMLVNQAALAFEFWTGKSVPPDVMKAAL